jgi:hypothetical protein
MGTGLIRTFLAAALIGLVALPAPSVAVPPPPSGGYLCPRQQPGPPPRAEAFNARELVGMRVKKARRVSDAHACELRVVRRNGEPLVVTQDFRTDRINVAVRHRVVKRIVGIY